MAESTPQTYATHRRLVPIYHFFLFGILVLNFGWQCIQLYREPGFPTFLGLLMAVGFVVLFFQARLMALTAQDRVIRLEERLRMAQLLPDDLKRRVDELTPGQFVALRFASDAELSNLVRRVLDEKLTNRDEIKKLIQNWRADHLRV